MRFRCQQTYADGVSCERYALAGKEYCPLHSISAVLVDAVGQWKWIMIGAFYYLLVNSVRAATFSLYKFLSTANIMDLNRVVGFTLVFFFCLSSIAIFLKSPKLFWPKLHLWSVGIMALVDIAMFFTLLAMKMFPQDFVWQFLGEDYIPSIRELIGHFVLIFLFAGYPISALSSEGFGLFSRYWQIVPMKLGLDFFFLSPIQMILWLFIYMAYWLDREYRWTKNLFQW